jgi:hypothetical protein
MGGGFYPRFVIACEANVKRKVAWIKYDIPPAELKWALEGRDEFMHRSQFLVDRLRKVGELVPREDARSAYSAWYESREEDFSPIAQPYAHRCRDHAMKLAMITALSREHDYIDLEDVDFAITTIRYIAEHVDEALGLPSNDAMVAREILKLLPTQWDQVLRTLGNQYNKNELYNAKMYLLDSKQMRQQDSTYFKV